jgi:hypothetical protein
LKPCRSRGKFQAVAEKQPKTKAVRAIKRIKLEKAVKVAKPAKVAVVYIRRQISRPLPRAPGMDAARKAFIKTFLAGGDATAALARIRSLLPAARLDKRLKAA